MKCGFYAAAMRTDESVLGGELFYPDKAVTHSHFLQFFLNAFNTQFLRHLGWSENTTAVYRHLRVLF